MSDWFLADILILIFASVLAIYAKIKSRSAALDGDGLKAEDFEILE